MKTVLTMAACIAVLLGLVGMIAGVTTHSETRRRLGLSALRGGMCVAGLLLIMTSAIAAEPSDAFYGLLLLVFGTGVTDISPRRSCAGVHLR